MLFINKIENMNAKNITSWVLRIAAAVILLQTLYFKFTGAEESIKLFTLIGIVSVSKTL